ncbi:MAG TPA: PepSY-associated TM helix domain-containing protein, partial [Candidatus Polarisedimenticolia bacterium]|nr:PepSY-associated TM helix domain-containing protein [Candidatus Polarisedimenticolia bacterium]
VDSGSGAIIVTGESPLGLRRVTLPPDGGMVRVEAAGYGVRRFFTQLHYRIGYQWNSLGERAWGFSVDLFAVTMLFWIVSGFWMWWTIRRTRRPGFLSLGVGLALFALFLIAL